MFFDLPTAPVMHTVAGTQSVRSLRLRPAASAPFRVARAFAAGTARRAHSRAYVGPGRVIHLL